MAEIENIHCPICTQPIPSSWQNGLPPALATSVQRGGLTWAPTDPPEEVLIFCYQRGGPTDLLDVKIELSWVQCTQFFSHDMKT